MSTYSNLQFGLKVLASDTNSFNLNDKGYNLVKLLRSNVSKLPSNKEIESAECAGVVRNIEKLWSAMVEYNSSVSATKATRKEALQKILSLEELICNSLGLNLREENDVVYKTETITVNQYEFFNSCFAIRHASKKERSTTNNVIDVVTLNVFKKAVLFGLSEACANDGELYKLDGSKAKTMTRIEKAKKVEDKSFNLPEVKSFENMSKEDLIAVLSKLTA